MSNIEIVCLNACFLEVFEVEWVKNDKCTMKDRKNPYVYVHERGIFKNTEFFEKTRDFKNVMKRPVFFSKDRSLERGIFKNTEFLKKHRSLRVVVKITMANLMISTVEKVKRIRSLTNIPIRK